MGEPLRFQHFEVYQDPDGRPLELGRGGMGVTYKAFDVNLGRDVALKVISPHLVSGEEARQRFLREARTAASFRHPHVASVYHLGEADGSCFYAMEFVEGETLEAFRHREGHISAATSLEILDQMADALGAAGKLGLVHRDIKPANIMLHTDSNGRLSATLIDFGLAKSFQRAEGDTSATLTVSGFVGTPAYASPEQLENHTLDGRSDIYSLGVTFYYMLCGKPPFSGSLASVISQHLTRPIPVSELAAQPHEIVELVVEMTAKSKEERPSNGEELRKRIAQCREAVERAEHAREPEAAAAERAHWLAPFFSGKTGDFPPGSTNRRGGTFEASMPGGGDVEVLLLHRNWTSDPAAFAGFESAIQKLNENWPPAFRKVLSVETSGGKTVAVCEKVEGIPLLEVLKARKLLHPSEAFSVLHPFAAALDLAMGLELACPDLTLHDMILTPAAPADTDLADWPDLAVRVDALVFLHQQADGGDGTMIPGLSRKSPAGLQAEYIGLGASLVCELLGSPRRGTGAFSPLPALTAAGNSVLQRALALDPSFPSLEEFIRALESAEEGNQRRSKPRAGAPALPPARTPALPSAHAPAQPPSQQRPIKHDGEEDHHAISDFIRAVERADSRALESAQEGNQRRWKHGAQPPSQHRPIKHDGEEDHNVISWTVVGMLVAIIIGLVGISLFSFISSPSAPVTKATPQTPPDASSSRSEPPVPTEDSRARAAAQAAAEQTRLAQEAANASRKATRDAPFENSLGMRFVPLPGRDALMSVWDTRVKDFRAYAEASGYRQQGGINVFKVVKSKDGKGHTATWELDTAASWENQGFQQTAAHPVVGVSWDEAKAFCGWLTAKERGEGKIGKDQEYRLPTDEEWSEAVGGTRYPWGNQWPPSTMAGNYMDDALVATLPGTGWPHVPVNDGYAYTSPVGNYKPNRLGLYDMGGNVWQWCEDWYRASMNEKEVLEKFPVLKDDGGGQKYRVLRGGSWWGDYDPGFLLSSFRFSNYPGARNGNDGFRCVLGGVASR